jgi:hypothetical protein
MSILLDANVIFELIRKLPNPAAIAWGSDHSLEDLARVVEFSADCDAVGLVKLPAVPAVGTLWKDTGDLDPPSLFPGNGPNLLGDLQDIWILVHDKRHIV